MRTGKNDFEILCEELQKEENPIYSARRKVTEYVGKDYDKFLRLKAEAEEIDFYEHTNTMMSVGALTISVVSVFYNDIIESLRELVTISERAIWSIWVYVIGMLLMTMLVVVAGVVPLAKSLKYKSVGKYRKYIRVILQEIEKDETWFEQDVQ